MATRWTVRKWTHARRAVVAAFAIAVVGCLLVSCKGQVVEFTARPRHACPGDTVEIAWKVKGSARITTTPAVPGAPSGELGAEGRFDLRPVQNTKVEVVAHRTFGSRTSWNEITMDRSELVTAGVGAEATCEAEILAAPVDVKSFAESVKVTTVGVRGSDERTYRVEHDGRHGEVGPLRATDAFAGTTMNGRWVLATPLRPGESCGTATLPRNLVVETFTECSGGASR
jgi:hypothetical protein